jgi:chemotaxis protein methyltransferase CheR
MTPRPFQPQVFAILSALVEEKVGLHYGRSDALIAWDKMAARSEEAGYESLLDYYYFLRYDDPGQKELRALVDALVVRETYFFREYDQLRVLCDDVLAGPIAARGSALVWSAACSTGEEPLSVAMMMAHRERLDRVHILASDVSDRALELARAGRFHGRAMRSVPPTERSERWLREVGGAAVVDAAITSRVKWFRQNLLDDAAIRAVGPVDAILCRNVLIYFDEATSKRVVTSLAHALRPGGALLVGVSESLLRLDVPLVCEERGGAFLYRKPLS